MKESESESGAVRFDAIIRFIDLIHSMCIGCNQYIHIFFDVYVIEISMA